MIEIIDSEGGINEAVANKYSKIVCISGSMRFLEKMHIAADNLRDQGYVVLYPSIEYNQYFTKEWVNGLPADYRESIEKRLDNMFYDLHLQKIDMCDELLVFNIDGYIGEKVQMEIQYAISKGKRISYLEPVEKKLQDKITDSDEEKKDVVDSWKLDKIHYVILGASQFYTEVYDIALSLTNKGHIVHPFLIGDDCDQFIHPSLKSTFDELIFRQVEQANVLYIVNKDDHINPDIFSFILHAEQHDIELQFMEPHIVPDDRPYQMGEDVKIIHGAFKGAPAKYFVPFPYPTGGAGHILVLTNQTDTKGTPTKIKLYDNEFERVDS